jgi:hypothetical protein
MFFPLVLNVVVTAYCFVDYRKIVIYAFIVKHPHRGFGSISPVVFGSEQKLVVEYFRAQND